MSNEEAKKTEAGVTSLALRSPGSSLAIQVNSIEDAMKISKYVIQSKLCPKGLDNPESVFIAMQMGSEVGLPMMQSIQSIAVINGRPTIWGQALKGMVYASGKAEYIKEYAEGTGEKYTAVCETLRKGETEPHVVKFSVADAMRAKLWGKTGPWSTHPKRMCQYKASNFCMGDKYPDVLRGLVMREVAQEEPTDITPDVNVGPAQPVSTEASLDEPAEVLSKGEVKSKKKQDKPKAEPKKDKPKDPVKENEPEPEVVEPEVVEEEVTDINELPDPNGDNDEAGENPLAGREDDGEFALD